MRVLAVAAAAVDDDRRALVEALREERLDLVVDVRLPHREGPGAGDVAVAVDAGPAGVEKERVARVERRDVVARDLDPGRTGVGRKRLARVGSRRGKSRAGRRGRDRGGAGGCAGVVVLAHPLELALRSRHRVRDRRRQEGCGQQNCRLAQEQTHGFWLPTLSSRPRIPSRSSSERKSVRSRWRGVIEMYFSATAARSVPCSSSPFGGVAPIQ